MKYVINDVDNIIDEVDDDKKFLLKKFFIFDDSKKSSKMGPLGPNPRPGSRVGGTSAQQRAEIRN